MYPSRFGYEAPKTLEEAIAILDSYAGEAKVSTITESIQMAAFTSAHFAATKNLKTAL